MTRSHPIRTCLGCGARRPQRELLRLVVGADARLDLDPARSRGGRGAYLCPRAECLAQARHRNRFGRALRQPGLVVSEEGELGRFLARRLEERIAARLRAARRCGRVSTETPPGAAAELLVLAAGSPRPEHIERVVEIDADALEDALGTAGATRALVSGAELATELEALAQACVELRRIPERPRRGRRERPRRAGQEQSSRA